MNIDRSCVVYGFRNGVWGRWDATVLCVGDYVATDCAWECGCDMSRPPVVATISVVRRVGTDEILVANANTEMTPCLLP